MNIEQIVDQMQGHGLPQLPHGHPVLDGKVKRFGPGKKAWYVLREIDLRSGRKVLSGAFGLWQGTNQNTVPVTMDWSGISAEERAEAEKKQAFYEAQAVEKKARAAELAANRAHMQLSAARNVAGRADSPYLVRKLVDAADLRIDSHGNLLVPMQKYSHTGAHLAGLQKIAPDGAKRYSTDMDKIGAGFLLGSLAPQTPVIGVGEGYATCASARAATDDLVPVMVAFDAGGILAVAQQLRRDLPNAHLLFLADDDAQLVPRFAAFMAKEFSVFTPIEIDGVERKLVADDQTVITVTATWHTDVCGTPYIEADVRAGRRMSILKFENAGISKCRAAARAVGNASVVWPAFADRGQNAWSDWNDLHVQQSLDEVRTQLAAALARVESGAAAPDDDQGELPGDLPMPPWTDGGAASIPAPLASDDPVGINVPTPEALIAHFSLIFPTTDIWDGLRKQRMKRSAFNAWVGKDVALAWEKDGKRRTILRDSLPVLVGGRAIPGGAGGGKLGEMLDNITLLRGTETVWDAIGQQVMTLGAVRADYTADLTGKWQEHALRKTVEAKNLVFDPTQRADPVTHVNIFLGWPLIPKANYDLVLPILALLESLCGAEDNVDECVIWILRWLAYPLQNPGAKMQTALLMFGEKQGTGKSLFFQDVMGPIYGDYGTVASQHQLDSSFTAWRSAKLFVLFEEVLSREDKYSHNGTLKYMITGKSMSINQKNLPERTEQNHLNAAFLSNEPQPIPIELEDRRFMVIEARNKQPEAFYNAVTDAIAKGGLAAFYDFLLMLPMEGFNAHTKPMMTLAKERVIEFGLNGWMSFHRSWKDGYLAAPYCSCLSEDLYTIYRRWCDKSGEKPLTLCKFAGLIAGREHKVKRSVSVGSKGKTTRMIFEVKAVDETGTVDQQIERFRDLADVRGSGAVQG